MYIQPFAREQTIFHSIFEKVKQSPTQTGEHNTAYFEFGCQIDLLNWGIN